MRILYGVVGEGMGHATRSRVILEHILALGHEVRIVVSGRAHDFLKAKFAGRCVVDEIHGFHLKYKNNGLDVPHSVLSNARDLPAGLLKNFHVFTDAVRGFAADMVISDFETFSFIYGYLQDLPVISIDNLQIINRCTHDSAFRRDRHMAHGIVRSAVTLKVPVGYHYLITSFFFPKVSKKKTTLIPPILRPEVLAAKREPGRHLLVYQTAGAHSDQLIDDLQQLDVPVRMYGTGKSGSVGNVTLCPFSETQFVDDLRTARAVLAGGGFSLMGEAVHLQVPMFSVPIARQYEQELNARYLQHLGYGRCAAAFALDDIRAFLQDTPDFQHALSKTTPHNNDMMLACVDELLRDVALGEPPKSILRSANLGAYETPLPRALDAAMHAVA
jgi:uncharacterized protein (TIGR00661 family)